jgi:hypothetical protein
MNYENLGIPAKKEVLKQRIDALTEEINTTNFEQKHREIAVLQLKLAGLESGKSPVMDYKVRMPDSANA